MRTTILTTIGVALAMGWHIGMAQVVVPTQPLNDTGMRKCLNTATNTFSNTCSGATVLPGQDGFYGRDNSYPDAVDGLLGFSFAKICNSGELAGTGSCPVAPSLGSGANQWGCTKDNVTGLIWEVKTSSGLRGKNNIYTNFGDGAATDASGFVSVVNTQATLMLMCGANDWRLPTVTELQSILNYSTMKVADVGFFPNSSQNRYWTSDGYAENVANAWFFSYATNSGGVDFSHGQAGSYGRENKLAVRLVRVGL